MSIPPEEESMSVESRPVPPSATPRIGRDSADYGIPARLLCISADPTLPPEWWRSAFSAHQARVAGSVDAGLELIQGGFPEAIVLDLGVLGQSGLEVYQRIRRASGHVPIIVVAAARANAAIASIKEGAFDCLFKPLDLLLLRRVVGEAVSIARRMRQPALSAGTEKDPEVPHGIVGSCPAMREVYKAIARVAGQDVAVLITGESGTGKELVARAIVAHGARARAKFIALNCAAIPEALLQSELFGHERGAFTGAAQRRIGKFEQCSGGTLFLDEIGDMPLALQAKILRLVQDQTFERVGGNETIRTNVRLIASTHRDLKAWSADGRFRADLYYRLGVFTIHLPPLRERGEDLPELVRHYVRRYSRELGRDVRGVATEALERLCAYSWPGNVRELESALKRAILWSHGPVLLPDYFPELSSAPSRPAMAATSAVARLEPEAFVPGRFGPESRDLYEDSHRQLDRVLLPRVLQASGGNQKEAARRLGIARQTLRHRLRELGLRLARQFEDSEEPASALDCQLAGSAWAAQRSAPTTNSKPTGAEIAMPVAGDSCMAGLDAPAAAAAIATGSLEDERDQQLPITLRFHGDRKALRSSHPGTMVAFSRIQHDVPGTGDGRPDSPHPGDRGCSSPPQVHRASS
jgi:two-component system nitrogen regulation response regulator GlnG